MAEEVDSAARTNSGHYRRQRVGMAHSGAVALRGRDGVLLLEPQLERGAIPATRRLPDTRRRSRGVPFGDDCRQRAGEARGTDWARGTTWPNEIPPHSNPIEIRRSCEPRPYPRLQTTEPAG